MEKTLQQIEDEINVIKIHMQTMKNITEIQNSINYYKGENKKIHSRKMNFVHEGKLVEDPFKSNTHFSKNDYKTIVDQLNAYLLGKEPTITDIDTRITKELPLKKAWRIAKESLKQCQIQKIAWVQPFINKKGNIDFKVRERSDNMIPVYSLDVEKDLLSMIIHYEVSILVNGEVEQVTRIEYWDKESVTYYKLDSSKKITFWPVDGDITLNPRPHVYQSIKYTNGTSKETGINNWGKVPFIPVQFNEEYQTALEMIGKGKIDALDFMLSDAVNNFLDMADVIYVLKDYIGPAEEALFNLKTKRAAVVGGDGGIDSLTTEIPMLSRKELIQIIKAAIYEDGMGVDLSNLTGGSLTNVLIEAYFTMLDMKADNVSPQIEMLYTELLTYVDIKQKDYPSMDKYVEIDEPTIEFNKSLIINKVELAELANKSAGFISDETRWSNDPRVDDAGKEKERMEAEASDLDEEPEEIIEVDTDDTDNPEDE